MEDQKEIDGDALLSVIKTDYSKAPAEDLNASMYLKDNLDAQDLTVKRYSIIGNDSSYKAYSKNYSYTVDEHLKPPAEEAYLKVTLRELSSANGESKSKDYSREQYRVSRSDLTFTIDSNVFTKTQAANAVIERTLGDFRKLALALQRLYPGCFVP